MGPENPDSESDNFIKGLINFYSDLISYLKLRVRQVWIWSKLFVELLVIISSNLKRETIQRMFWGRNSFYKNLFHLTILSLSAITFLNGISQRIVVGGEESQGLNVAQGQIGQIDTFLQYANAKTFTVKAADELPFEVREHTVKEGETLESIAEQYGLDDVSSIQWANGINPYNSQIKPDQILKIPPMKGVLKQAQAGDTPTTLVQGVEDADIISVLELNDLDSETVALEEGRMIFIPNGSIPLPPPPRRTGGSRTASYINLADPGISVPAGTFVSPLLDAGCSGYYLSRGWASYHTGLDLVKSDGCWINAVGSGRVSRARWGGSLGFYVVIEHENGFQSLYLHGNGEFAVREGDYVSAGQKIMYMGSTGNAFGTHLHFSLSANENNVVNYGSRINPAGIIPF